MKTFSFKQLSEASRQGFSLFELLMCVAGIGVLVSIALPMVSLDDNVYAARDRRNAQELSAISSMAQAAGLDFVQGEDVVETVRTIVRGGMPMRGAMKGRLFVVPGLSEEDIKGAAKHLQIEGGALRYSNSEVTLTAGGIRL